MALEHLIKTFLGFKEAKKSFFYMYIKGTDLQILGKYLKEMLQEGGGAFFLFWKKKTFFVFSIIPSKYWKSYCVK